MHVSLEIGGYDMITREMIRNGFESGTVSIEEEYAGCIGICCRIGDNALCYGQTVGIIA